MLGYFYGDGCFHCAKKRDIIHFVCTTKFAEGLRTFVYKNNITKHCVVSSLKRNNTYSQVVFQGKHAESFGRWLFSNIQIPLLPRKHPPYAQVISAGY
jgi:hypothetical protein